MRPRDEILADMERVTAAFVPRLPPRRHWWSLPRAAVTTSDLMQPLDDALKPLLEEFLAAGP